MQHQTALITDSASDLTEAFAERYHITIIPLRLRFTGREYRDRTELAGAPFYRMLENEIPKSSLPARDDVLQAFDSAREAGCAEALYIGMSSGLSGTFHYIKSLGEEAEGLHVRAWDSRTLSCAEGCLVAAAARALESTGSIDQAVAAAEAIRRRMHAYFVVRSLTYLRRGGRIGKVEGAVGSLLRISPVITVNDDGVYETAAKTIGYARALQSLADEVKKHYEGRRIVISAVYGEDDTAAHEVAERIQSFAEVAQCCFAPVSAALGSHTGPDLAGLAVYEV
jgi:DegV family protein with EDD domain